MFVKLITLTIVGFLSMRPMTGQITELHPETDSFIIEEYDGNLWECNGIEDYSVGDFVFCVLSDMGTPEVEDDIILSCRYCG